MTRHREAPSRRVNPGGAVRWVARWTDRHGRRRVGWPPDIPGTYVLKREAQDAIDACYDRDVASPRHGPVTVRTYFEREWLRLHPRTARTEQCYQERVRSLLGADLEGAPFGDWPMPEVGRRQANLLVGVLLVDQGRAASGAQGVMAVLSAMWQDALDDERAVGNPFSRVKVRASDPRVRKPPRPIRVWSWAEMHELAAACGEWEPLVRVMSDCGLRIGEALGLERRHWHGDVLEVRQTVWEGRVLPGTKTDHGAADAGRVVPVAADLEVLLRAMPRRIDSRFLFADPGGGPLDRANWCRRVLRPAWGATGLDIRPHEFRHSWITHLRAAGVDPADLADMAGHSVETATRHYVHALRRSYEAARRAVG